MAQRERTKTCTADERVVLDMIACWPGVPALVMFKKDGGWSVSTPDGWGPEGVTLLQREDVGLPPETRTSKQMRAAEEEERLCEISWTNLKLNDEGLQQLGKGGKPLDEIFKALNEAEQLHRSGGVLMSPESTLQQGAILFVGLNPGGDAEQATTTILDNLAAVRRGQSAWEEEWKGRPGEALLQKRFKQVAHFIGRDPLSIPATNVVFTRSRDVASHRDWSSDRAAAMAVHRILADTIRPEKLWFMGNPDVAGDLLKLGDNVEWRVSGHGNWSIGHGTATYAGHPVEFCHTPHLSRWDPTGKEDDLRFAFGLLA